MRPEYNGHLKEGGHRCRYVLKCSLVLAVQFNDQHETHTTVIVQHAGNQMKPGTEREQSLEWLMQGAQFYSCPKAEFFHSVLLPRSMLHVVLMALKINANTHHLLVVADSRFSAAGKWIFAVSSSGRFQKRPRNC